MSGCAVLVADADSIRRALFVVALPAGRFSLTFCDGPEQALDLLARERFVLAAIADATGAGALREAQPALPILLMSERYVDDGCGADEAKRAGADGWLPLPFDEATFEARAEEARARASRPARDTGTHRAARAGAPEAACRLVEDLYERLGALDHYGILGVEAGSAPVEIKHAYFARVRELHPDRFAAVADSTLKTHATRVFIRVSEAFAVLSNPQARQQYDARLRAAARHEKRQPSPHAEVVASTAAGRTYVNEAMEAQRRGDIASTRLYLMLAAKYEPWNAAIRTRLAVLPADGVAALVAARAVPASVGGQPNQPNQHDAAAAAPPGAAPAPTRRKTGQSRRATSKGEPKVDGRADDDLGRISESRSRGPRQPV